jgi:hypothetical protein
MISMLSWRELADIMLQNISSPPLAHHISASRTQPHECATPKALKAPRFRAIEASQEVNQQQAQSHRMMSREKQNSLSLDGSLGQNIAGETKLDMATCR